MQNGRTRKKARAPSMATAHFQALDSGSVYVTFELAGQEEAYTVLGTDEQVTEALLGLIHCAIEQRGKLTVRVCSDHTSPAAMARSHAFAQVLKTANVSKGVPQ